MQGIERRSLLKGIAALPVGSLLSLADTGDESVQVVTAGSDRTGEPHKGPRANSHLEFKVLTSETNGRLFILENKLAAKGGPYRHLHYEQEEWFFLIEGADVAMEIGDQKAPSETRGLRAGSAKRASRVSISRRHTGPIVNRLLSRGQDGGVLQRNQ
jgi:hypothetical protein